MCFYLYFEALGYNVKRNPVKFFYTLNGKKCYTFVDFSVDGTLFEIKGDYLYEKMQISGTKENAKLQCLLENNVKILTSAEYKMYESWFYDSNLDIQDYLYKKQAGEA